MEKILEIRIPGWKDLRLGHLVLDYNGTLALDGRVLAGVKERLARLAALMDIHILTADTFGTVTREMADSPVTVAVIPRGGEAEAKAAYVRQLGREQTVAVGNGNNDRLMLQEAALGIAVVQGEGAAAAALAAAAVISQDILSALDLLLHPSRLIATLRT